MKAKTTEALDAGRSCMLLKSHSRPTHQQHNRSQKAHSRRLKNIQPEFPKRSLKTIEAEGPRFLPPRFFLHGNNEETSIHGPGIG